MPDNSHRLFRGSVEFAFIALTMFVFLLFFYVLTYVRLSMVAQNPQPLPRAYAALAKSADKVSDEIESRLTSEPQNSLLEITRSFQGIADTATADEVIFVTATAHGAILEVQTADRIRTIVRRYPMERT